MAKIEIDKEYVAAMLIELLYEKGLVNKETYMNIYKHYNLHISQAACYLVRLYKITRGGIHYAKYSSKT